MQGQNPERQERELSWETAVDAFLWVKRVVGCSKKTLDWHRFSLQAFRQCHADLHLPCPSPLQCPSEHLRKFLEWAQSKGLRPISIDTYFRSIRAFFRWLHSEGLRNDIPTNRIPLFRTPEPLPRTVTEEHFLAAIKTLNPSKFSGLRNLTLFVLAFDSGARLSELLNLRFGQIDLETNTAKVCGKGNRERIIVFGRTTSLLLRRYLTLYTTTFNRIPSPNDFVFVFRNGSPLDPRYVLRAWHDAQKKAGLQTLPFHGLRHGFARVWLLRGGDAISLQILLGHKSSEMTRRYVTLWGRDLKNIHEKVSPVDRLHIPSVRPPAQRKRKREM
jgi:site-specific recombinase XerD